jgi:hypothetical protein
VLAAAVPSAAVNHLIVVDEVLGSWQGNDAVQFIELRLLAPGQGGLSPQPGFRGGAALAFDDAGGSGDTRQFFQFLRDLPNQESGARVLIATAALQELAGVTPDFVIPPGVLQPRHGRVCYAVIPPAPGDQPTGAIDCVAYGRFTGENGSFGRPTPLTPDDRSLQRGALTGVNVDDWGSVLQPTPENNQGQSARLDTLCGDGLVSQGEACDGAALGGATCASLGFARGTLACDQCHYDTSGCTSCGNDAVNEGEECDGPDLGGRTCGALGFTGGTLGCTARCRLTTADCDPTFFVPGGGPRGPECLAAWRVTNAAGRPGGDGKAPVRQACRDGDPGCDADAVPGTCTFTVAVCLDRVDARLARKGSGAPRPCRTAAVDAWTLLRPPAGAGDPTGLVAAVAALGPSATADGTVAFSPALDDSERCTEPVAVTVPLRGSRPGKLQLRARTVAAGGAPRDVDTLKLVCRP